MSESAQTEAKPTITRRPAPDAQVFAHVEKWMAMIREIVRDLVKS